MTILCYHRIMRKSHDDNTVSIRKFTEDMIGLMGKKVVYLDDYDYNNPNHIVITFDDGYKNIYNALPILKELGYPFEVFILGSYLERGNNNDKGFLSNDDIKTIINFGGRIQYHSYNHPRLDDILDEEQLEKEIKCPSEIKKLDNKGFKWFAYPFFSYNDKVIEYARKYYIGACSGKKLGNNNRYTLNRIKVTNDTIVGSPPNIFRKIYYLLVKLAKKFSSS